MVKDVIAFYPFAFTRVIIEDILNLNFWINQDSKQDIESRGKP